MLVCACLVLGLQDERVLQRLTMHACVSMFGPWPAGGACATEVDDACVCACLVLGLQGRPSGTGHAAYPGMPPCVSPIA